MTADRREADTPAEGEDIEVLERGLGEAAAMIRTGEIRDATTMMLIHGPAAADRRPIAARYTLARNLDLRE